MFLSDYLGVDNSLYEEGIFDPILEEDSHFFINIQRLKRAETPEFQGSYERINDFFRKIIKLLDRAIAKDSTDICYKQALALFDFPEVNGIGLGFSKDVSGAGFGPILSKRVIDTAYDIVKAGVMDPEFFQLLPLFQDDVGPDRLSDMIAKIILVDIEAYTRRINIDLEINASKYDDLEFEDEFLVNPYRHYEILLLPIEILHKLPVAKCWEDIDSVVSENNAIRAVMNQEVAEEWTKWSSADRKMFIREKIFKDTMTFQQVMDEYRKEELGKYNPEEQIDYFLARIWKKIQKLNISWESLIEKEGIDTEIASIEIIERFKKWVEYNKGWEVIQGASSKNREKILQRVIHLSGQCYVENNNLDMSCEPDEGRGPVDFKISRGLDKTLIEVKLSSNSQYLHGYETQVEEYGKAENTDKLVYVLADLGNPGKVKKLVTLHERNSKEGKKVPEVVIIDATPKESASRA